MGHIKNIPSYANKYQYLIARKFQDNWWYWGATNNWSEAVEIAEEINGEIFTEWCDA